MLRTSGREHDLELTRVIEQAVSGGVGSPRGGRPWQVFLLRAPNDALTLKLPQPIAHPKSSAWTQ